MPKVRPETPIDFLVRRKFGQTEWEYIYASRNAREFKTREGFENLTERIAKYREELAAKPSEEIQALCLAERKKMAQDATTKAQREEDERSFNQPHARAKYDHWCKCAGWTTDEAIALSLGRDPGVVTWERIKPYVAVSSLASRYAQRRDLVVRAISWQQLFDPVLPTFFLAWARQYELDVPPELEAGVTKFGGLVGNWKDIADKQSKLIETDQSAITSLEEALRIKTSTIEKQSALIDQLRRQAESGQTMEPVASSTIDSATPPAGAISTRELGTFNRLILGMALAKYNYKLGDQRSSAPRRIAEDLETLDLRVTHDTIRDYLKEAEAHLDYVGK